MSEFDSPTGPAASPGSIDWSVLATLAEDVGDRDFVVETVQVYLSELPGRIGAIVEGAERGDAAGVKAAAQSHKSSSGMLGALGLARICRDLEAMSDPADGSTRGAVGMVAALTAEAEGVTADLTRYADGEM